ncbi:hypothetical protein HK102_004904, partial [Quaeritorhiza haematococci]
MAATSLDSRAVNRSLEELYSLCAYEPSRTHLEEALHLLGKHFQAFRKLQEIEGDSWSQRTHRTEADNAIVRYGEYPTSATHYPYALTDPDPELQSSTSSSRVVTPLFLRSNHFPPQANAQDTALTLSTRSTAHQTSANSAKAQELRESLLQLQTEKLKSKADKIQAARERQQSQIRQLKEAIHEKMEKAEKLRETHIETIKNKAKDEKQKLSEIAFISALSTENRKIEVEQRHWTSQARLQELEDERLRKLSETAALQEAASERRKVAEQERKRKILAESERKRELEARKELERREASERERAKKEEKLRRLKEFKSIKQQEEEELRRGIEEKLEKGSKRSQEHIEQVKVKAAERNLYTKLVASKVQASRTRTPEKNHTCLVCRMELAFGDDTRSSANSSPSPKQNNASTSGAVIFWPYPMPDAEDRDKTLKRKTKKMRQRLKDLATTFQLIPSNTLDTYQLPRILSRARTHQFRTMVGVVPPISTTTPTTSGAGYSKSKKGVKFAALVDQLRE